MGKGKQQSILGEKTTLHKWNSKPTSIEAAQLRLNQNRIFPASKQITKSNTITSTGKKNGLQSSHSTSKGQNTTAHTNKGNTSKQLSNRAPRLDSQKSNPSSEDNEDEDFELFPKAKDFNISSFAGPYRKFHDQIMQELKPKQFYWEKRVREGKVFQPKLNLRELEEAANKRKMQKAARDQKNLEREIPVSDFSRKQKRKERYESRLAQLREERFYSKPDDKTGKRKETLSVQKVGRFSGGELKLSASDIQKISSQRDYSKPDPKRKTGKKKTGFKKR